MGQNLAIPVSTFLFDSENSSKDSERIGQLGLSYHTSLACSDLVFTITENVSRLSHLATSELRLAMEARLEATSTSGRREVVPDHLAYLLHRYEIQGFLQRVAELLIESWRSNTNTAYNSAWCKWHSWCIRQNCDPTSASVNNIMQFLVDQFDAGLQYHSINTLRSAISMTHATIDGTLVGHHLLISRLL